jgi:hypothetical protein
MNDSVPSVPARGVAPPSSSMKALMSPRSPTGHSQSFGPSSAVPGAAYPLLRLSALQCLTSFADDTDYYALC